MKTNSPLLSGDIGYFFLFHLHPARPENQTISLNKRFLDQYN